MAPPPTERDALDSERFYDQALAARKAGRVRRRNAALRKRGERGVSAITPAARETDQEMRDRLGTWGDTSVAVRETYRAEVARRVAARTSPAMEEKSGRPETEAAMAARARRIERQWERLGLSVDEIGQIDDLDAESIRDEAAYQVGENADTAAVRYN